jgi:hypothetical protein
MMLGARRNILDRAHYNYSIEKCLSFEPGMRIAPKYFVDSRLFRNKAYLDLIRT